MHVTIAVSCACHPPMHALTCMKTKNYKACMEEEKKKTFAVMVAEDRNNKTMFGVVVVGVIRVRQLWLFL